MVPPYQKYGLKDESRGASTLAGGAAPKAPRHYGAGLIKVGFIAYGIQSPP